MRPRQIDGYLQLFAGRLGWCGNVRLLKVRHNSSSEWIPLLRFLLVQVFVALQQLREYESAMAAREEAEAAEQAEEGMAGEEGEPAPAAAEAVEQGHPEEALHKSRSEQAAAALAQNLEELRASSPS